MILHCIIFNFYGSHFQLLDFRLCSIYLLYNACIALFRFIMYSKDGLETTVEVSVFQARGLDKAGMALKAIHGLNVRDKSLPG